MQRMYTIYLCKDLEDKFNNVSDNLMVDVEKDRR